MKFAMTMVVSWRRLVFATVGDFCYYLSTRVVKNYGFPGFTVLSSTTKGIDGKCF